MPVTKCIFVPDTDKKLESQWHKSKLIITEIKRDYLPVFVALFSHGLPSGKQLLVKLEEFRTKFCRIMKVRRQKSLSIENDEVKNDEEEEKKDTDEVKNDNEDV